MDITILIWLACFASALAVFFATLVIVDFMTYVSGNYKERYLEEATVELDDVLLQMPASRILDVSFAVSALSGFLSIGILGMALDAWSWPKACFFGLGAAVIAFPMPRLYLRHCRKVRMRKFNEQLEDALSSMSSSLKAGFSINQAIESVAHEGARPISVEFRLLVQEIRLGVSLDEALYKMVDRLDSQDFELVATAIITARQTGGELTVILERLASVIRERSRINGRLVALTAQGKLQASVIGAMPFLLMFILARVVPGMMSNFFNSVRGLIMIGVVVVSVAIGFLWIKKITTIDI